MITIQASRRYELMGGKATLMSMLAILLCFIRNIEGSDSLNIKSHLVVPLLFTCR